MSADAEIAFRATGLALGYRPKGEEPRILARGVDLALRSGDFVCIIGPNGSGKSTLIRAMAGMAEPLQGKIEIQGADMRSFNPKQRARCVSVALTQALPLGLYTARSLVALGRHPHTNWMGTLSARDRERIAWALDAAGATALADRLIGELSDGERQKVVVARALAQDAAIILLDEPTAFLDLPRRVELLRNLRDLAHRHRLSVAISTHDLDLALRCADQLWLVGGGRILVGLPEELVLDGSLALAFASDKLDWDASEGSFRMHRDPCAYALLEGSGHLAHWTKRALARIGYGVCQDEKRASLAIRVKENGGRPRWIVEQRGTTQTFDSLSKLIEALRPEWPHQAAPKP